MTENKAPVIELFHDTPTQAKWEQLIDHWNNMCPVDVPGLDGDEPCLLRVQQVSCVFDCSSDPAECRECENADGDVALPLCYNYDEESCHRAISFVARHVYMGPRGSGDEDVDVDEEERELETEFLPNLATWVQDEVTDGPFRMRISDFLKAITPTLIPAVSIITNKRPRSPESVEDEDEEDEVVESPTKKPRTAAPEVMPVRTLRGARVMVSLD